jgi:predicted RNase H-like nuclease (RuvC/YqgF family)
MDKNNLQGFDYIEFKQFLKSLDKMEMDEATKFRSAFATGQTMGATKENLINSGNRYLEILKQEEERFEQAVKNQRSKSIDDRQSGIAMLEKSISEKEQQIAELATEIENARKEIQQRREEVALAQAKVLQTQSDFQHTYKLLMGQVREDIQKINTYLS